MSLRFETVHCQKLQLHGGRAGRSKARGKGGAYSISPGRHPSMEVSFAQRRTSRQLPRSLIAVISNLRNRPLSRLGCCLQLCTLRAVHNSRECPLYTTANKVSCRGLKDLRKEVPNQKLFLIQAESLGYNCSILFFLRDQLQLRSHLRISQRGTDCRLLK